MQLDPVEVDAVARGIATAVAPENGLTTMQASLLRAVTLALTDVDIDYRELPPLGADELAEILRQHDLAYRHRIVHHMVLGELVLRPLPDEVARRVETYAAALGVEDDFVRVARRYAEGRFGLAWADLRRSGFTDRWQPECHDTLYTQARFDDPFDDGVIDDDLARRWRAFATYPAGTLGRSIWEMYEMRGFNVPGSPKSVSAYLAQHDFVHVIADYGTQLEGELEVFTLIGRADPDPRGFAWLATVVGLFETGYVHQQGFFQIDVRDRHLEIAGMTDRIADALLRGKAVAENFGTDLLSVDYHAIADRSLEDVRAILHMRAKSPAAIAAGSPGILDPEGMSANQRAVYEAQASRRESGA
jgi:hypothetical protein